MATLTPLRRVLATAAAEIGYSRWKDDKQGTKYARETQPVFWPRDTWLLANGISFCDLFVTWVFWKALGEDFVTDGGLPAGASYNTDYRASKGGRVSKPPRPGDVLVFDWNWATLSTNHVGILEKVLPSGNYQTIEGNTSPGSSGSQGNGGGVYRRTRRPGQVRYVIRPNWAKATSIPSSSAGSAGKPWTTSPRVNAMSAAEVRAIQTDLVGAGYSVGSYGVDGSYGDGTGTAVQQLQTDLGLTADGVWGPTTQEALMTLKSDVAAIKARTDRYLDHKTSDVVVKLLAQLPKLVWGVGGGANAPMIGRRFEKGSEYPETTLGSLTDRIVRQQLVPLRGEVAGLSKAIEQLAAGRGVDPEEIKAAVAAGVDEALGSLEVTVSKGD